MKGFSPEAVKAFDRYCDHVTHFAIFFEESDSNPRAPKHTICALYPSNAYLDLFHNDATRDLLFREVAGSVRLKVNDLRRGKMRQVARALFTEPAVKWFTFPKPYDEMFPASNGTANSILQEELVTRLLNETGFGGKTFLNVGHKKSAKQARPDVESEDGEITVEVKGKNGVNRCNNELANAKFEAMLEG